jgi:HlyD family secretion protein
VDWISADQEDTGENKVPAFKLRLSINSHEYNKLGASVVGTGMEAEVMFTGTKRKVISYIAKPLTDQLQRAFRER